jgi:hypothetical protein
MRGLMSFLLASVLMTACDSVERPSADAIEVFGEIRQEVSGACSIGDIAYSGVLGGWMSGTEARAGLTAVSDAANAASNATHDADVVRFLPATFSPAAIAGTLAEMHDAVVEEDLLGFANAGHDLKQLCLEARRSALQEWDNPYSAATTGSVDGSRSTSSRSI